MTQYLPAIISALIGAFVVIGYKRVRRLQTTSLAAQQAGFSVLSKLIRDTSSQLYNEVSNIWLETNRAKLRPQFCSLLIMHPGSDQIVSKPCLMASSVWLGPDQDHCFSFSPDIVIPAGTLIVATGPCDILDIVIANEYQGFFTTPMGQVGITRTAAGPGHRVTVRLKGWPLRPSTMSEAELVRQASLRAVPPWDRQTE